MRNFTNTLVLIFALTITFSASATSNKIYEGYVVTKAGEKIEGKIRMMSPALNEVKVKFIGTDNKKRTFKSKELKSYSFEISVWNATTKTHETEMINYVNQTVERSSIAFGPKEVLLQREAAGTVNLYNHYIEQNSNVNAPIAREQFVQKDNAELILINKKNYKKVLKLMTAEYPELQAKIGTRGYGVKHIAKILKVYNNWMIENSEETVAIN